MHEWADCDPSQWVLYLVPALEGFRWVSVCVHVGGCRECIRICARGISGSIGLPRANSPVVLSIHEIHPRESPRGPSSSDPWFKQISDLQESSNTTSISLSFCSCQNFVGMKISIRVHTYIHRYMEWMYEITNFIYFTVVGRTWCEI